MNFQDFTTFDFLILAGAVFIAFIFIRAITKFVFKFALFLAVFGFIFYFLFYWKGGAIGSGNEDFMLEGTSHQTGISEYFTWEYNGEKIIFIPETQEITIVIDPNGTVMGSVSVDILKN